MEARETSKGRDDKVTEQKALRQSKQEIHS